MSSHFHPDHREGLDEGDGDADGDEADGETGPVLGQDGGVEVEVDGRDREGDEQHRRERGGEGLEDAAPELRPDAGLVGLRVGAEIDLLARGEFDGRRAEPGIPRRHQVVGGRLRLDAHQHVVGDHGARWHYRVVADEDAGPGAHGMHVHPASADFLLTEHDLVGDEVARADIRQIVASGEVGGDLRPLPHPRAHQPVPGPHVDGGEE